MKCVHHNYTESMADVKFGLCKLYIKLDETKKMCY